MNADLPELLRRRDVMERFGLTRFMFEQLVTDGVLKRVWLRYRMPSGRVVSRSAGEQVKRAVPMGYAYFELSAVLKAIGGREKG